tara:strand:+ start:253 stop:897 length:645 start_codon:yes stop_codon:yes gene_type:complete
MGLFDNRLVQLLSFLAWIAVVMLVYTLSGELRPDESYRYMLDVGFNIGTGVGNIAEKDEWITLFTVFVMLTGYFAVALFWVDFVSYLVNGEEAVYSSGFKALLNTGTHYSRVVEESTGITRSSWAYLLTLVWLALGVVMGMVMEDMSFITALNFAVGLMTSTGSQQCSNEMLNNYLTGSYMLIGIPLLAMTSAVFISSQPSDYTRVADAGRLDL